MNMNFPQNISKATVSDGIANWYHGNVDEKKKKKFYIYYHISTQEAKYYLWAYLP